MSAPPRTQYLLYLDECGTHDMQHVDPAFPVFVLLGLLVGELYYAKTLVPRVKNLKKRHFGAKDVLLHSREIRRCEGPFHCFRQAEERKRQFYEDLNALFTDLRIRLYAVCVHKQRLHTRFLAPVNPYHLSLNLLLSLVCGPRQVVGPSRPAVCHILAESRGKVEDRQLQREFQEIRHSGLWNYGAHSVQDRLPRTVRRLFPERIEFLKKSAAAAGLELADLAAYPLARASLNSGEQPPKSAQVIFSKLRGLAYFP